MKRAEMKLAWIPVVLALSVGSAAPAPAAEPVVTQAQATSTYALPKPQIETLSNGLTIAWFLSDSIPIIDVSLMVKSGFRDDPVGKTGTAEMVSALLDRGAGDLDAEAFGRAVESLGATRFSSADDDTFSLGMHGLSSDGARLTELLAKMALSPRFPESEVVRERDRFVDHWSHVSDYAESLAGLAYYRIIRSGTSYGRGNFLSIPELKKITRADLVAFHQKHFTPANSVLIVVGKADRPAMRLQIEKLFGSWKGEAPAHSWKDYVDARLRLRKGQIVIVDRPGLTQAQVRIGSRAPLISSPDHYPLLVANAMLGEYFNSRLNSIIRDKLGLTYAIGSGTTYSKDFASFTISSATRNETVGELIEKTLSVLKDFKKGPIPSEETQTAREYLIGQFPLAHSTLGAVAARWLRGYYYGLGPSYLEGFVPAVSKISSAEISAALGRDLNLDQLVIVIAGDAKAIQKSLAASHIGNPAMIRVVKAKDLL